MQGAQDARCEECGKTRGPDDDLDYSPIQVTDALAWGHDKEGD